MRYRFIFMSVVIWGIFVIFPAVISGTDTKVYSNKKYGISFTIPEGIKLYTVENPGPLAYQISSIAPFIFVNPDFTEENINVRVGENVSESDVSDLKEILDKNPPALPQYQKISISFIKIGKQGNKTAVEHVFIMQGNILGKLRQVTFEHRGRGFIFTCGTAVDRFDKANQQFFDALFSSMEFK